MVQPPTVAVVACSSSATAGKERPCRLQHPRLLWTNNNCFCPLKIDYPTATTTISAALLDRPGGSRQGLHPLVQQTVFYPLRSLARSLCLAVRSFSRHRPGNKNTTTKRKPAPRAAPPGTKKDDAEQPSRAVDRAICQAVANVKSALRLL